METKHVVIGGILVAGLGYLYLQRNKRPVISKVVNTFTHKPGYSDMMKIHPSYYNNTSMEGNAFATQSFVENSVPISWTLGAEQGNAMSVNPGYGTFGDGYASSVANSWLQGEAQGAHL